MLLSPTALNISKSYELTERQAQALVDLEATCADLGLMIALLCKKCSIVGDRPYCDGSTEPQDDGTVIYGVKCLCSSRSFRGALRMPPAPGPVRNPRLDLTVIPEVALSRHQMRVFQDAADCLHQLQMAYAMRCLACRLEDRATDGVWGAAESNASQFVLECACTKRIYKGSDVKLVN